MSLQFRILWTFFFGVQFLVQAQPIIHFPHDFPSDLKKICQRYAKQVQPQNWPLVQNQMQLEAYGLGYFLFESNITQQNDSLFEINLDAGPRFESIELISHQSTQTLKPSGFQSLVKDSLAAYLDHGYPFVKLTLETISANEPRFRLKIDKGPRILFGELVVKPEGIIQAKVLGQLLQIEAGKEFSIHQLEQIRSKLALQPGIKLLRDAEWLVQDDRARVFIYLERVKTSSATGMLGLQPNPLTQKNALVGELQLSLQNAWQKNEKFSLNWRSIAPQVQMLQSQLSWPYIAGSAYGLHSSLKMYKRDTTFLEFKSQLGLQYQLPKAWQILGIFDFWRSSNLQSTQGSQLANFRNVSYGLGLQRKTLNNLFNPTKGQVFSGQFLVGTKKVTQAHLTWRLEVQQQQFIPLAKRHTLLFQQQFCHIASDSLYRNELYRFGGLDRMRGFDEEAFFATTYAFAGLEYRFILDEFAYAAVFTDWAAIRNQTIVAAPSFVSAIGIGLSLGSEKGSFKLNYALGSYLGQPYQLNAGKIHLAYISYF